MREHDQELALMGLVGFPKVMDQSYIVVGNESGKNVWINRGDSSCELS